MEVRVKGGELGEKEINSYVDYVQSKYNARDLVYLEIEVDGEFVNLRFKTKPQKFNRIRRITGYLVPDLCKWNDAKTAEERDRVKHI